MEPIRIQEEIPVIENKRISESDEQACDTTTCLDKAINFKLKDWYGFYIFHFILEVDVIMNKSVLLSHNIIIFLIGVLLGIGIHITIKACTEK